MTNKERIILIAGCSHAAGFELDGGEDSEYNRRNSFGGKLGDLLDRKPVNIAMGGQSNAAVARSVLNWFDKEYDSETMDVFVLFAWTEATRIDLPAPEHVEYSWSNTNTDFYTDINEQFLQINSGWDGINPFEKQVIPYWHDYQVRNEAMCLISGANFVLQMQFFMQAKNIDYVMCNTMPMFTVESKQLDFYLDLVDESKYLLMRDDSKAFYWYYRNKGYENEKAKYWHHDAEPHRRQALRLYNFIKG